MALEMTGLLADAITQKASDLFISVDARPLVKVEGKMRPLVDSVLDVAQTHRLIYSVLRDREIATFEATSELNKLLHLVNVGRFRINVFRQRGEPALVARHIKDEIPSIEQLGLPEALQDMVMLERGLILVVGGTGNGKSTTLAARGRPNKKRLHPQQEGAIRAVRDLPVGSAADVTRRWMTGSRITMQRS